MNIWSAMLYSAATRSEIMQGTAYLAMSFPGFSRSKKSFCFVVSMFFSFPDTPRKNKRSAPRTSGVEKKLPRRIPFVSYLPAACIVSNVFDYTDIIPLSGTVVKSQKLKKLIRIPPFIRRIHEIFIYTCYNKDAECFAFCHISGKRYSFSRKKTRRGLQFPPRVL